MVQVIPETVLCEVSDVIDQDTMTYIPPVPSTHGISPAPTEREHLKSQSGFKAAVSKAEDQETRINQNDLDPGVKEIVVS